MFIYPFTSAPPTSAPPTYIMAASTLGSTTVASDDPDPFEDIVFVEDRLTTPYIHYHILYVRLEYTTKGIRVGTQMVLKEVM